MPQYAYIKPKARRSAQGRRLVIEVNGKREERTKAKGTAFVFQILKKRDGTLNTGLDYHVPNDWHKKSLDEVQLPSNWSGSDIWKRETITKQEELELKYNQKPGFFTNVPETDPKKYTYMQTFMYRLEDTENVVDLNTMKGEIFFEAANASPRIANSEEEALYDLNARFFISSVNQAQEKKATMKRMLLKANSRLDELEEKHGVPTMRKVAVILGLVTTQTNSDYILSELSDFINDNPKKSAENITKFNEVYKLLSSPAKRRIFNARFLLKDLVNYRVLSERLGAFYWKSREGTSLDCIGKTEATALAFLTDKSNEPHIKDLEKELETYKGL